MNRLIMSLALAGLLGGCAGPTPPGIAQTQAMTDMDGRPIAPDSAGIGGVGIGIGFGSWGHHNGGGAGFGMRW